MTLNELYHHGILGQKWGQKNGPPYPLDSGDHSAAEKKAGWRKSLDKSEKPIERKLKYKWSELKRIDKERNAKYNEMMNDPDRFKEAKQLLRDSKNSKEEYKQKKKEFGKESEEAQEVKKLSEEQNKEGYQKLANEYLDVNAKVDNFITEKYGDTTLSQINRMKYTKDFIVNSIVVHPLLAATISSLKNNSAYQLNRKYEKIRSSVTKEIENESS